MASHDAEPAAPRITGSIRTAIGRALSFAMRALRIIAAWPTSWALYGIAHLASLLIDQLDHEDQEGRLFDALYTTYQRGMATSYAIQEWAEGTGPALARFPWAPGPEGSAA